MACFGGGSTIFEDNANAYNTQEVKLRQLHIWFAESIHRPDLSPTKLTGIPSQIMDERTILYESQRKHDQKRGETAAKISKLHLEDTEAKLCNAINAFGEEEFYAFLTGHGFLNKNATDLAHWYQSHKEVDKERKAKERKEQQTKADNEKRKRLHNSITNLSSERLDKLIELLENL